MKNYAAKHVFAHRKQDIDIFVYFCRPSLLPIKKQQLWEIDF